LVVARPSSVFFEEEELRFGGFVDGIAHLVGAVERVLEDAARVALEGLARGGVVDVTDHSAAALSSFWRHGRTANVSGSGFEPHVRLLNANEAFDRRTVEVDPFGERLLGLSGRNGDVLDRSPECR